MRVHVNLEPVKFVVGYKDIEKFLIENDFIVMPKHITHSVWAT